MASFVPVILAGGSGTRLWPASRQKLPKQLTALFSQHTLIQETVERLQPDWKPGEIYIDVTAQHLAATKKQLPEIPAKNFIVEPQGRNTAGAIALVAALMARDNPHTIVATLASDHVVEKPDELRQVLHAAHNIIQEHPKYLMTIGIKPTEPNTGLGYIQMGSAFTRTQTHTAYHVKQFKEKPDSKTASTYVNSMKYLWNANYLVWRADHMLNLFKEHAPEMYAAVKQMAAIADDPTQRARYKKLYSEIPSEPIDTVINEKARDILVLPADLGWNDIGSWETLHEVLSKREGSSVVAKGHHIGLDDKGILVRAGRKLVATVGLQDIVIVDTPDVLLVLNKKRSQDVKRLIERLKEQGKEIYL